MNTAILRSVCVGVALAAGATVLAAFVGIAVSIYWIADNSPPTPPGVEVGYDLVTMVRNWGISWTTVFVFAVVVFSIGFLVGFRYFSRPTTVK